MRVAALNKKYLLSMVAFVLLFGCIGYAVLTWQLPAPGQPSTVQNQLRGGRMLIMRLPTSVLPFQQIDVFTDGHADRIPVVLRPSDQAMQMQLPPDEWQAIDNVRKQWCAAAPPLRTLRSEEAFYAIGLRCGEFDYRQLKLPIEALPAALGRLLTQVPVLQ